MNPEHMHYEAGYGKHPGGQQVSVPTPAVRATHLPTGLTASCDHERSQLKNKQICNAMIEYGLAELGWKEPGA